MADLTVTEALVTSYNTTQNYRSYEAAEAITAGQLVYVNSAGLVALADAGAVASAELLGVALTGAAAINKFLVVAEQGLYVSGATMVAGTYYAASDTAGGIAPFADIASSSYVSLAILAESTTEARILVYNSGVVKA